MVRVLLKPTVRAATLSLLLVLFAIYGQVLADVRYETVRDVIDGDTIVLQSGEKVRLAGINTPELGHNERPPEPLAEEATRVLRKLIGQNQVVLEEATEPQDHHGRTLAYLSSADGRSLQRQLLLKGLASAVAISPNLRYLASYSSAEAEARVESRGIWGLTHYRARSAQTTEQRGGYTFVHGTVRRIEISDKWFVFGLAKHFVVLIRRANWKRYFDYTPCSLDRIEIAVRGWVSTRGKRSRLVITHPFMLERCGRDPASLCPQHEARRVQPQAIDGPVAVRLFSRHLRPEYYSYLT